MAKGIACPNCKEVDNYKSAPGAGKAATVTYCM